MEFSTEYLERLSAIESPKSEMVDYEDGDVCDEYGLIRNYAQGLLRNPEDKESREGLSNLLKKLEVTLK